MGQAVSFKNFTKNQISEDFRTRVMAFKILEFAKVLWIYLKAKVNYLK